MPEERGEPPPEGDSPVSLAGPERAVLLALRARPDSAPDEAELARQTGLSPEILRGSLQRLRSKRLAVSDERHRESYRLTPRGEVAARRGLPERRLLELLRASGRPVDPTELAGAEFTEDERSAAIGTLRRRGHLAAGVPLTLKSHETSPERSPEEGVLLDVRDGRPPSDSVSFEKLKRRGLVEVDHLTERRWSASAEGQALPLSDDPGAIGPLTPDILRSGSWRDHAFRPYDVRAPVPRASAARPHPYLEWVRQFEAILVGLGFTEESGPLLETEFWNHDVLYMPQDHPARSIHDVLRVRDVEPRPPDPTLLGRVAAVHEGRPLPGEDRPVSRGWKAPYDPSIARRPVLRSQTTAVSARFLAKRPIPPFRMFCLERNFRRDAVDPTHHIEFGQCEGVVGEEGISLRHLAGIFRTLAEAIGIRELKIRPSYFPFTEPSIEGYVRHPRLGWIEVFPGGLFRPEVLRPLGVQVPVAAWGIGVTRLAMVALGVSDIRELFVDDLARLTRGPL